MNTLPLSWSLSTQNSDLAVIKKNKLLWYAIENLPSMEQLLYNISTDNSEIIIRGCNQQLVNFLGKYNFSSIQFGEEAVLKTSNNHFVKKSLRELVNRGKKKGQVIKVGFENKTKSKLQELASKSVHGVEPQLLNLFQTMLTENNELFVYINNKNEWLAATMLSKNSPKKLHTELLLRKQETPIGAMEYLIKEAFDFAKEQNYDEISLGEVPFKFDNCGNGILCNLLKMSSKMTNFAYNHEGLYKFKNKFNPNWEPLFICANPKIRLRHLIFIMNRSNFKSLMIYKSKFLIKNLLNFLKLRK